MIKTLWNENKKSFFTYWIVIIITMIVAYVAMYVTLHVFDLDIKKAIQGFKDSTNIRSTASRESSYWQGSLALFKNNWLVCVQILALSFLPIPFLYNLSVILTSASVGVILAIGQKAGMNVYETFFLGILPHSVLELSVFIFSALYARKINSLVLKNIANLFRKNKKELPSFWRQIKDTVIVFIIFITPGIFIAALIEGYISRFLLNM
jgi:stage II sporulation protein M